MSRRSSIKRTALATLVLLSSTAVQAADWAGTTAVWSSNANPGWNGTGVPNGVGAIANFNVNTNTSGRTTVDTAGIVVGAINFSNTGTQYRELRPNGITLDNGGAGATITVNGNTVNALWINTGSLNLNDNLTISNLSTAATAGTNGNGTIQLTTQITGNGSITFNSAGPITTTDTVSNGAIWLNSANTYAGNSLVQRGLLVLNTTATPFGNATNVVTLGQSGSGSAGIITRDNVSFLNYSMVVAPSAVGETRTLGSASGSSYTVSNSPISLLGDLNLRAGLLTSTGTQVHTYSGVVSGIGGINKTGVAIASLSGANTFTGKVSVSQGTLRAFSLNSVTGGTVSSSLGAPTTVANGTIDLGATTVTGSLLYSGAGETTDRVINLSGTTGGGVIDSSGTGALTFASNFTATGNGAKTLTLQGTNTGNNTIAGAIVNSTGNTALTKAGAGKWILSGTNTYSGATTVSGGNLQFNSNSAVGGSGASVAVNSGGTASAGFAIDQTFIGRVTAASAGVIALGADSSNAIDFASAGLTAASLGATGVYTYSGTLTPNGTTYRLGGGGGVLTISSDLGGASNSLVVGVNGTTAGTVVLSSTNNTYGGGTVVNSGVLQFANASIAGSGANVTVNSGGTASAGFAIDQMFLQRIAGSSAGVVALAADSSNALDFNTAGLTAASLGATGAYTYSGTLNPNGTTYRLGGGGGTLTVSSALVGAGNGLTVGVNGSSLGGVVLTGANTYDGVTTIAASSSLTIGDGGTSGTLGTGNVANAGTLQFNRSDNVVVSNTISGAGSLIHIGPGMTTLTSANTYAGTTRVSNGILKVTGSHTGGAYQVGNTAGSTAQVIFETPGNIVTSATMTVGDNTGNGTVTQLGGSVTVGASGTRELYLGYRGGTGHYDLQAGSFSITGNGYANIGRDGIGIFDNRGTFTMTQELRIGLKLLTGMDGVGTVNNLDGGMITANVIHLGNGASTGNLSQSGATSKITTTTIIAGLATGGTGNVTINDGTVNSSGAIVLGNATGTVGNFNLNGGTVSGTKFDIGSSTGSKGTFEMDGGSLNVTGSNDSSRFIVGLNGEGHATLDGGTITAQGRFMTSYAEPNAATPASDFTMNGGTINTPRFQLGWGGGNSTIIQNGGTVNASADTIIGTFNHNSTTTYTMNNSGSLINTANMYVGYDSNGVLTQNNGTIKSGTPSVPGEFVVGLFNGSKGTYNLNNGTVTNEGVLYVGTVGGSEGTLKQAGGTITNGIYVSFGQLAGSTGHFEIIGGSFSSAGDLNIGDLGTGTMLQTGGNVTGNQFILAYNPNSTGTATLEGGTTAASRFAYVGLGGSGTLNLKAGGSLHVEDNYVIGADSGSVGVVNQTGGSLVMPGNLPVFTGNIIVGATGTGTYNISGNGTISNTAIGTSTTLNSATTSIAASSGPGHELDSAADGNLIIGRTSGSGTGTGVFNQSGASVVNIGANVLVGSANANFNNDPVPVFLGYTGGKGTLAISGGTMNVGATSPTGGDIIIGSPAVGPVGSVGTINLSGGVLNVANGTGVIASAGGMTTFNFTGGTLKVKEWNKTIVPTVTLGDLTQNGVGSLLDVTTNSTIIRSGYALGAGNATVGAGQTLTIEGGMTNLAGTGGIVNVNANGTLVSKNVRTDTLNVASGTVTINQSGLAAGTSKVETLNLTGTAKLNLKDNDLVVGTAPNFNAVRAAIIAGKTNNAASGITSDMTGFGISRGFGYAMGNGPGVSPLLMGSLSGQAFDADSVLVKFTLLGDADLDGDTDLNDLGLWSNGYTGDLGANPPGPTTFWTSGDFDYDGDTDLNDLGLWSSTYTGDFNGGPGSLINVPAGTSAEAISILNSMGLAVTVVPEPSTFVLAGVGLAGLAIAARRRKK